MGIYLISDETNKYKIGVSKDPKQRLKTLQTSNPTKLKILHYIDTKIPYKIETVLKRQYKLQNSNGEWFNLEKNQIDEFENTVKNIESNLLCILETSSLTNPLF